MVSRVERAGFRAIELTRAYEQAHRYPEGKWLPKAASFLTSPAVAEQIRELLPAVKPDMVIVDQMFPVGLLEAKRYGQPSIAICHTSVWRCLPMWRRFFAMLTGLRVEAGFDPIPSELEDLWMIQDKMIVTTLASMDKAPGELVQAYKLRHVGPVLERERHATRVDLPWSDDKQTPMVLVSFSTAPEQGSVQKFQNAIDVLGSLNVTGVVTVGDSIDPAALRPAKNVRVFATADHDDLMRRASLVVTHGGHGTLMRALKNGLPVVVIPGSGGDQPLNAEAAEDWGVGRALPQDADADTMRTAIEEVLNKGSYRKNAAWFSQEIAESNGAARASDEIETLLPKGARKAS
jgi:MGT family glycosyltransferase